MEEKEFKDYKEKQKYYRNRAKEKRFFWISTEPNFDKKKTIIKGRTYVKGEQNDSHSK